MHHGNGYATDFGFVEELSAEVKLGRVDQHELEAVQEVFDVLNRTGSGSPGPP